MLPKPRSKLGCRATSSRTAAPSPAKSRACASGSRPPACGSSPSTSSSTRVTAAPACCGQPWSGCGTWRRLASLIASTSMPLIAWPGATPTRCSCAGPAPTGIASAGWRRVTSARCAATVSSGRSGARSVPSWRTHSASPPSTGAVSRCCARVAAAGANPQPSPSIVRSTACAGAWGRLIDSYVEGVIDRDEFQPRVAGLKERLARLAEQRQALIGAVEVVFRVPPSPPEAIPRAAGPGSGSPPDRQHCRSDHHPPRRRSHARAVRRVGRQPPLRQPGKPRQPRRYSPHRSCPLVAA